MKAVVWHDVGDIRLDNVPEPRIEQPTDAVVRITTAAICGTDPHFVRGTVPNMRPGKILGPDSVSDAQALPLSDIYPTGYFGSVIADVSDGDVVAVYGCGPVGQFAASRGAGVGDSPWVVSHLRLPTRQCSRWLSGSGGLREALSTWFLQR
jgi:threonine dehydrogenase-like Zn-dependent dehydrogenase